MDSQNLSPRLQAVAQYVKKDARLADIGSDHGYLPAHLLLTQQIQYAVAGEVAVGPLENVQDEIDDRLLHDRMVARLANGLAAIEPTDNIDTVTIAGMGGALIRDILSADDRRFANLILQPNVDEKVVREWLMAQNYHIIAENIVQEGKHFYEIIHAQYQQQPQVLSHLDITYGPYLRQAQSPAFITKWQKELARIALILERLTDSGQQASPTYHKWQKVYQEIEEVLS
jgi:tRNA (adenine22-N1)-methyltransferase